MVVPATPGPPPAAAAEVVADTLAGAIRGNVARALHALRDLRPPSEHELEQAAAIGRERADQGLTVDAVLHAYRISVSAVWSRFGELARASAAPTWRACSRSPRRSGCGPTP